MPACGFDFHSERHLDVLLPLDELAKLHLRTPRPSNVLDPARVDARVYTSMAKGPKHDFDRAWSQQFKSNKQYEDMVFLGAVAVDLDMPADEKLDTIAKLLSLQARRLLHDLPPADAQRTTSNEQQAAA